MRVLATLVAVVLIGAAAALAVIYLGAYNVAATDPHLEPVRWALDTTFKNSVRQRAEGIEVPPLDQPGIVEKGARRYAAMCATCHGAPGQPLPSMARHMRPQPPQLSEAATEWAPNEIFWIVENGVKMTGMPAWGPWHADDQLWSIVAVVERLPEMSDEAYGRLIGRDRQAEAAQAEAQAATAATQGDDQTAATQGDGQAAGEDGGASPAVTVDMTGTLEFKPETVTVTVGDTVEWINVSNVPHTVTADADKAADPTHVDLPEGAEPFNSGFIQPDGRFTHRFTVPGHYTYFCIPHEAAGMIGEVVVKEAASAQAAEGG